MRKYIPVVGRRNSRIVKRIDNGDLSRPIQITAHLQLLNQRGDHGHVVADLNHRGVGKVSS